MAHVRRVAVPLDVARPLELGRVGVARADVARLQRLELLLRAELVGLCGGLGGCGVLGGGGRCFGFLKGREEGEGTYHFGWMVWSQMGEGRFVVWIDDGGRVSASC